VGVGGHTQPPERSFNTVFATLSSSEWYVGVSFLDSVGKFSAELLVYYGVKSGADMVDDTMVIMRRAQT